MDKVFIEGLEIEALIGIYDWERRIRQPLRFDLEMAFDNRRPAASDAIEDTLDYKAVSKRLIAYVSQSGFGLVETLAERCAALVLEEFGVEHVRLKLSKPGAVRGASAVGVIIERSRASLPQTAGMARGSDAVAVEDDAAREATAASAVPGLDEALPADARPALAEPAATDAEQDSARAPEAEPSAPTEIEAAPEATDSTPGEAPPAAGTGAAAEGTPAATKPPVGFSFMRVPISISITPATPLPPKTPVAVAGDRPTETTAVDAAPSREAANDTSEAPVVTSSETPAEDREISDEATSDTPAETPPATTTEAPARPISRADFASRSRAIPAAAPPPRPHNPASALGRATRPAYLSLGSNIDAGNNLRSALRALRARFGEVIVSPVYRIPAVGFDGPDFLNAAAIIDSDLDPFALVTWLQGIESAHGRLRGNVKNSSRTLDMDIVYFDNLVLDLPGRLQLPRPELRHAFVLKPLADIAPGFVDPVRHKTLAELWAVHPERDSVFEVVRL